MRRVTDAAVVDPVFAGLTKRIPVVAADRCVDPRFQLSSKGKHGTGFDAFHSGKGPNVIFIPSIVKISVVGMFGVA